MSHLPPSPNPATADAPRSPANASQVVYQRAAFVALVGNPNTGKTTLFNALTGFRERVGNYPGVTVDKTVGILRQGGDGRKVEIVDLPGAYSLAAGSADEAVVLDVLLGAQADVPAPDVIVAVIDATNLGRSLFLVSQLLELDRPVVTALNMVDLAEATGVTIDAAALSRELGVPVVPVVARTQKGVAELIQAVVASIGGEPPPRQVTLPEEVAAEVAGFRAFIAQFGNGGGHVSEAEVLQALLDSGGYHEERISRRYGAEAEVELHRRRSVFEGKGVPRGEIEARIRYAWIDRVRRNALVRRFPAPASWSERVDRVLTHRVLGLAVLILLMGAVFQSIYAWAAPIMDAVDTGFAWSGTVIGPLLPTGALRSLVVDGVIAGVGAVLIFLPQILILFLFLAILEDCGYMARAAFLLDRWMGLVGLSGKSFIPLLSSFACAVPGIMATRTIEDRRDRLITILVAPLMSCSARLPVYVLLIGAFVPSVWILGGLLNLQAVVLLSMYVIGVIAAVGVVLLLKRTIMRGPPQAFLMELPSYKWPSVRTVLHRVVGQGKAFVSSAGTIIFAVTLIIWALGYYPRPASIGERFEQMRAEAAATFEEGNGQQAARGSHGATEPRSHGGEDRRRHEDTEARRHEGEVQTTHKVEAQSLDERLAEIDHLESGAYLRHSLLGRMGQWIEPVVKPLGWDWRIGTAVIASFPAREVVVATMGTIYNLGGNENEESVSLREKLRSATWPDGSPVFNIAVALSIMVFFALCCQCGGTLATIKRETRSWTWPIVTFVYMTSLAYVAALATYQLASHWVS
ncbi:MAG: ferrous iron transport protein B [Phycisphaerae bacterium]|nr:ferrous iron transport protein B [Phycisphaerae bacterium]